jgi:phosphohistidine phosphatase SixA
VILVRHAHAGNKANWDRDDGLRPLTERGVVQAAALVRSLADDEVQVVWSSPSVRCRQTVQPLAVDRGVVVQDQVLLAKDAPVEALLAWLLVNRTAPWVLCTHGEVVRTLLYAGRSSGLITAPARVTEKGAAWRVEVRQDAGAELQYLPPLLLR